MAVDIKNALQQAGSIATSVTDQVTDQIGNISHQIGDITGQLKGAAANIGGSISDTVKEASSISSGAISKVTSVFGNTVKEDLALIDSTAKNGIKSLNAFKDTQLGKLDSFIKSVTGNIVSMKDLNQLIDVRNGFKVNYDELTKRLSDAAGFPLDSIVGMTNDIKRQAADLLDAYSSGNVTRMLNAAGIKFKVNDGSYQMMSMLSNVISRMSEQDSDFKHIVDETAQMAFLNTMLQYTVAAGLWQGIDEILNKYTIKEEGIRALGGFSTIAVTKGDVYTLQAIVDRCGIAVVRAKNQDLPVKLMRYFAMSTGTKDTEYADYKVRLLGILNAADPEWDSTMFGPVKAMNLAPFTRASQDAIKLLRYDDKYRDYVLIAKSYLPKSLVSLIKENYPKVAIFKQ